MSTILLLGGEGDLEQRLGRDPQDLVVPVAHALVEGVSFDIRDLMIDNYLPDIILLGPDLDRRLALSIASLVDAMHPGVSVVLMADPDATLVLEAMRVGVRDVLPPSATDEELRAMMVKAQEDSSRRTAQRTKNDAVERVEESKVIVVVSPKGGVGKSTIASNLAVGLAKQSPMDVVLVDLDLQFGDIATHLDLNPAHNLTDAFASSGGVDSMLLKTFLTVHPSNFYALCGSESPAAADRIGPKQVRELLSQLALQFRFVVVDTGAGLDEHTLAALEEANEVIMVSSMDVSSVRNVRKEFEVLAQLNILPHSRHFVLNFADRHSGMSVRDVEAVVGIPVNVVVPRASEVYLSANRGIPVLLDKKGGAAAKAIRQLVKRFEMNRKEAKKRAFQHKGVDLA
ncbi:MAG: P-loop NTPase [Actinomycetota bacterium]|nr:P-loop NTPase [Actinomycetota bacterium]